MVFLLFVMVFFFLHVLVVLINLSNCSSVNMCDCISRHKILIKKSVHCWLQSSPVQYGLYNLMRKNEATVLNSTELKAIMKIL